MNFFLLTEAGESLKVTTVESSPISQTKCGVYNGPKLLTVDDGWVWLFSVEEHWNSECLGWHVCKVGDRFAALEPITQAVRKTFGSTAKGVASGLMLRIDNGVPYTSDYFLKQIDYLGIQSNFGLVCQPQTNGLEL
jgi:putative transposase